MSAKPAAILDARAKSLGGASAVVRARRVAAPVPSPFSRVDLSSLGHVAPPAPSFWWGRYLPAGEVTGAGGHGEAGKSTLLGVQLGAHLAVGAEFLGHEVRAARVAYFSAEDPASVVLYRLDKVCRLAGLDVDAVRECFHVLDASESEAALFVERRVEGVRMGTTTAAYAALADYIEHHGIDVVIVDNASDVFESDEITRAMVRRFVRSLAMLVRPRGGAVVLLMHVDKKAARGEAGGSDNYSGSTAWHNSVRSRLFLKSTGDGTLDLLHEKSNFGKKHLPIALRWPVDGLPELDKPLSPVVQGIADRGDVKALLALIHEFSSRGESVATSQNSPANAARMFAAEKACPKRKPGELAQLLRDAERQGLVARETYRDTGRKPHERWRVTALGCRLIGVPAPSAPSALSPEDGAAQPGAGTAPSAPSPAQGGCGGVERAQKSAPGGRNG